MVTFSTVPDTCREGGYILNDAGYIAYIYVCMYVCIYVCIYIVCMSGLTIYTYI